MNHSTELKLLDEIIGLKNHKTAFLDPVGTQSPIERYLDTERFEAEKKELFETLPQMAAHSSELPQPGSFLRREMSGLPLLFSRDSEGRVRAFVNVCRHRGATLVREPTGCQHRFTCPYHGWSWTNQGDIVAIPHRKQGFPNLESSRLGLKQIECVEKHGWIWVQVNSEGRNASSIDSFLCGLQDDFKWFGAENLVPFKTDERIWNANWKILMEGGLESYHFRVAHKDSLAPFFYDNLSTYQMFGLNVRSILPRTTVSNLLDDERKNWKLREHVNALYLIFPISTVLVQQDHVVWFQATPLSVDKTLIRLMTLRPKTEGTLSESEREYWTRNHQITRFTLNEDFGLGEEIQAGLSSGANTHFQFGRYEGALSRVNDQIETLLNVPKTIELHPQGTAAGDSKRRSA